MGDIISFSLVGVKVFLDRSDDQGNRSCQVVGRKYKAVALVDAEGFDLFVEGVEDLKFGVQEVVGDVNFVVVRVDEASLGRTEMRQGVVVEGFLLLQCVAFRAPFAVLDDLMLEGSPGIFTGLEDLVLVAVLLVVDREGLTGLDPLGEGVSAQTSDIGLVDLAKVRVFFRDPVGDLESGVDQLDSVLGAFQDRATVDLDEFVDIAEAWGGLAGGDGVADSVGIYAGSLTLKIRDEIFIKRVGRKDFAAGKSVVVKDSADFDGEVGEVAAVEAHAVAVGIFIIDAALLEGTDGVEDSAFEGVVGVDEEDEVLAPVGIDVVHEGFVLAFDRASVGGDEAMGHRAGGRDSVQHSGEDVGGAGAACDDRRLGSVGGRPRSVSAA